MYKYTKYDSGTFITVPCRGSLVKLPPQSAYLFMWLANFNSDNKITPSVQTLCDLTGMSKNTVLKYMDILIERGLVVKEERKRSNGAQLTNRYAINLNAPNAELNWDDIKKLSKKSEIEIANMVQTVNRGGSNVCTGGVQAFEHKDKSYKDTPYKELSLHDNNIASSADATLAAADKKEPTQDQSAVDVDSSLSTLKNIYSGHSANYQSNLRKRGKNPRELGTNPRTVGLMDSLVDILGGYQTMERLGKLADWRNNDHTSQEDSDRLIDRAKSFDGTIDDFLNSLASGKPKTQETASTDRTAMLKKGNVFNPAAYALVANLAKKLGSHEGKASKKVLIALRSVIVSNPKLVENNCDLFMKCAEQLASDNYQVNLGNNNVEFLLNHISKYLNLAAKGGVQTNDPSEDSKSKSISIKY